MLNWIALPCSLLCVILCLLAATAPALGQGVGAMVSSVDPGPYNGNMGLVSIPVSCQAWTYTDPYGPATELDLSIELYANGSLVQSDMKAESGFFVSAAFNSDVSVGLDDVSAACLATGTLGVMSDSLVLPGRFPIDVRTEEYDFQFNYPVNPNASEMETTRCHRDTMPLE